MNNDLMNPAAEEGDLSIRPGSLTEFIGQKDVTRNLQVYLQAAAIRNEALDHILFSGPPGLGKTTLSRILADSQGAGFHQLAAPNLTRPGDLARVLTVLGEKDVLFIDEIHRMPAPVEEVLYSAMEDRMIDITLSEGMAASSVQIRLPAFTLVGATTRPGSLSAPLRDRFGIQLRLDFYENDDIALILERAMKIYRMDFSSEALTEIAGRSRRTPRIALRLLRRVRDHATVARHGSTDVTAIGTDVTRAAFREMGVDDLGLTSVDLMFLRIMAENYDGGPVGLKPIAAVMAEDVITLEDFIEPYLVRIGFLRRTPRGRMLDRRAWKHLGIRRTSEGGLFEEEG